MLTRCFSRHIILFIALGISCLAITAQSKEVKAGTAAKAKISVNRSRILLGEQLDLSLKLEVLPGGQIVRWPVVPDSLGHFEILNRSKLDSTKSGETMTYVQTLTLTSFDSGRWVIPAMSFTAGNKTVRSDSLAVDVTSIVLKGSEYNDIKEIIELPEPGFDWKKWLPYIIGTLLLLILLLYWLKNRKKKPVAMKPVSRSTAFEEALAELKKLKAERLAEKGEMKQYYSRLYDIYRIYIGRITGAHLLQSTTDDVLLKTKDHLPSVTFSRIAEVLRISDAVKFAKYPSSVSESDDSWEIIHSTVQDFNRQKA